MRRQRHLSDRIFDVLDCVRACGPAVTLADLAIASGLPKPTALRIVRGLVARGVIARTMDGYCLGAGLTALGLAATRQQQLPVLARPYLLRLQPLTDQIVLLTSATDGAVETVDVALPRQFSAANACLSWRRPDPDHVGLLCTAVGRLTFASHTGIADVVLRGPLPQPTLYPATNRRPFEDIFRPARDEALLVEHEQYERGYGFVFAAINDTRGRLAGTVTFIGQLGSIRSERDTTAISNAKRPVSGCSHLLGTQTPDGSRRSRRTVATEVIRQRESSRQSSTGRTGSCLAIPVTGRAGFGAARPLRSTWLSTSLCSERDQREYVVPDPSAAGQICVEMKARTSWRQVDAQPIR